MKRVSVSLCFVIAAVFTLTGCAATHTAIQITKANQAVKRAKDRGAAQYATYEYTMAEHYLNKAREEAGASDFKDSVQLAHGAAEWADKAIIAIEKEGRDLDEAALPGETRTLTEEDRIVTETDTPDTPTPAETPDATQTEETPEIPDDVTSPSDEPTPTADTPQKTAPEDNNEEAPQ